MVNRILYVDVGGTHVRARAIGKGKVSELVVGIRGVWTPAEKAAWKRKLQGIAPTVTVLSDVELAHRRFFQGYAGIVLNAGTGSIAFGQDVFGNTARAGGLGPLLGDEGSAFWIGREHLKVLYQITPEVEPIRRYLTGPNAVAKIAGLAKKVLKTAEKKPSSYERRIVEEAMVHLRHLVREVRFKLKMPASTPIHLTGGLFKSRFFKNRWRRFLSRP